MTEFGYSYLLYPFLAAFAVCILTGPFIIKMMQKLRFGQQVRDDGPASHLKKQNVPTMGGIMIVLAMVVTAIVFGFEGNAMFALFATLGYGLIGFLDDYIKIAKKRSLGLKAYQKIIGQFLLALIVALHAYNNPEIGSSVFIPFLGYVDFGFWYIPFAMFVIIAITNGENLADGLDGLVSRMTLVEGLTIGFIAANVVLGVNGNADGNSKSQIAMLSVSMAGACLGFLRFNSYPARIFMGDTGSLALGGCLAICALFTRMAMLLPIMCVMLVATCISVILQVGSFKLRHGKRIFKMAPLHHHYELLGYHETTVTSMYTIITIVSCALALIFAFEFK